MEIKFTIPDELVTELSDAVEAIYRDETNAKLTKLQLFRNVAISYWKSILERSDKAISDKTIIDSTSNKMKDIV